MVFDKACHFITIVTGYKLTATLRTFQHVRDSPSAYHRVKLAYSINLGKDGRSMRRR